MALADLYIYENSTLSEIMYQAGKFGDQRVIYYWLGHTITDEQVDTDDTIALKQACIGLVQMGHDALLEKVMNEMPMTLLLYYAITQEAAKIGNIRIVEIIVDDYPNLYDIAALTAAEYGHTTLVWLLLNKGYKEYDVIMRAACLGNHENIVEDALRLGATDYTDGLEAAILGNNINLVMTMIDLGGDPRDNEISAGHSSIKVVQLLEEALSRIDETFNYDDLLDGAAYSGNMEILDYALSKGGQSNDLLRSSVESGDLNMVKKVVSLRINKVSIEAIHESLILCRMDILNLLGVGVLGADVLEDDYYYTLSVVARKGCIPAIIWCLNNGARITAHAIKAACQTGNINVIKILMDKSDNVFLRLAIDTLNDKGYYRKANYLEQM